MASTPRSRRHERAVLVVSLAACMAVGSGCAVVNVAGAAAGAAISVGGAVVGTTVKVAGKVVEKTIDIAVPGSPPAPAK
jgi:coenzyme F420-reducing hydrogenase gamma subunit